MKFTCPHCQKDYDLEKAHSGQRAKCKQCNNIFFIHETIHIEPQLQPPIDPVKKITDNIKIQTINSAKRIWNRSPSQFRNAFLATFGVLSALMISLYLYGNIFYRTHSTQTAQLQSVYNPQATKLNRYHLGDVKAFFETIGLYHDGQLPKLTTFRGRNLYQTTFFPDSNFTIPSLHLYSDINGQVIGCFLSYIADSQNKDLSIDISSVKTKQSSEETRLRNQSIIIGYNALTADSAIGEKDFKKTDEAGINIAFYRAGTWFIEFKRITLIDNQVYGYQAIAQNW